MELFRKFKSRFLSGRKLDRSPHNPADTQSREKQNLSPKTLTPGDPGDGFIPVVSSWIAGIRFESDGDEDEAGATGFVQIRKRPETGGGTMTFSGVPETIYDDFFAAGSKGEFFNNYIRDKFAYLGES